MKPRPYTRSPARAILAVLVLLALLAWRWSLPPAAPTPATVTPPAETTAVVVQRVVDGDTLLLADGLRVRLMGVDCPESVKPDHPVEPFGPEASAFTRAFVASGPVQLQYDLEREDQYGRLLAYVFVNERMLNEELIRAGLARFQPQYRYADAMKRRFRRAEDEARAAGRGIWGK